MPPSGNGAKPSKSSEEVASELRQRLESRLGSERTEAIWRDPTNIQSVVHGEDEAASVAEIMLQAWRDLPEEETVEKPRRRTGFRRGLRIALVTAVAVWGIASLRKAREVREEEGGAPI